MANIAFTKLLLIFALVLLVLGPERLPALTRTVGHFIGRARAMARHFQEQWQSETSTLRQSMDESLREVTTPPPSATQDTGAPATTPTDQTAARR
jgi:sec-independent protein translocase protein TatB